MLVVWVDRSSVKPHCQICITTLWNVTGNSSLHIKEQDRVGLLAVHLHWVPWLNLILRTELAALCETVVCIHVFVQINAPPQFELITYHVLGMAWRGTKRHKRGGRSYAYILWRFQTDGMELKRRFHVSHPNTAEKWFYAAAQVMSPTQHPCSGACCNAGLISWLFRIAALPANLYICFFNQRVKYASIRKQNLVILLPMMIWRATIFC